MDESLPKNQFNKQWLDKEITFLIFKSSVEADSYCNEERNLWSKKSPSNGSMVALF